MIILCRRMKNTNIKRKEGKELTNIDKPSFITPTKPKFTVITTKLTVQNVFHLAIAKRS